MKTSKFSYLFAAACIALLTLLTFQVNWLLESKELIESQFDQKVNLALGNAIAYYNSHHTSELVLDDISYCVDDESMIYIDADDDDVSIYNLKELETTLARYLQVYQIDKNYRISILDELGLREATLGENTRDAASSNTSSTNYLLAVSFPGKRSYVFSKMKYMSISSVLILLVLSTVFILIWRALLHQRKITENNIDFFNNTAHELKTPLTNVSLAMNLLTKKIPKLADDRYAMIVKKESKKLMNQVERVLHLSRMESGDYELRKEPVNLKNILEEVITDMQILLEARQATLKLNANGPDYIIEGDKYHLGNVFRNLIDNALKYSKNKPVIEIQLESEDEGIFLHFRDNGIGISKLDQEHIFEKFQRVTTGDVHNQKGFGIGLSYVKTVIEMHKGFIKILSDLNKGSQFDLFIPHC